MSHRAPRRVNADRRPAPARSLTRFGVALTVAAALATGTSTVSFAHPAPDPGAAADSAVDQGAWADRFEGEVGGASAQPAAVPAPAAARTAAARVAAAPAAKASAPEQDPAAVFGTNVLSLASGLSGIWYRWGGTTTSGFDCSGFTQYVYRKAGVKLPRTAAQQQRATRRVSSPRPGDLVFFGSPAHHVGIYAGNNTMYDAPRTGKKTGLHKIWSSRVTYGRAG